LGTIFQAVVPRGHEKESALATPALSQRFKGRQGRREGTDHGVLRSEIQFSDVVKKEGTIRSRSFE
jgi:hypothetical protein